jgi:Asp-tRNA(Asn)/Glu-tRNA(Gln) amidotransferase A subunit family amidase
MHDDRSMTQITRRKALRLGAGALVTGAAGLAWPSLARRAWAAERRPEAQGAFAEYRDYDGLGLARLVKRREVTASQLLESAIERMNETNEKLNAIVNPFLDRARARAASGTLAGPFQGVPFLLKDLHLELTGTITTNGSRLFRDRVATWNSTLVDRYEAAGLVCFAKSTSPEFGLSPSTESALFGPTHNPWNLHRTPGGSSGGSAAAVAAGVLPIANASDGGGSIRIPASCCGLFGMKPSRARTPLGPTRGEGWNGLTHVHAVSRSVRDSAALLDACSAPEPGSTFRAPRPERPFLAEAAIAPKPLRIAMIRSTGLEPPLDPQCLEAVENAGKLCEDLGHAVEVAGPEVDGEAMGLAIGATVPVGLVLSIDARLAALGRALRDDDLEPVTRAMYEQGKGVSGAAHADAQRVFYRIARDVGRFQDDGGFDVLMMPTLGKPPVELGIFTLENMDTLMKESPFFSPFTMLFNATGQPAMSVPLHWTPDGLPVGVMFVGRYGDEATLYRLAGQLELAQPWGDRRPPI